MMTLHYLSWRLQSKFRVVVDRHYWRSILEPGHLSSTGSSMYSSRSHHCVRIVSRLWMYEFLVRCELE